MPTPFSHLVTLHSLLHTEDIPGAQRQLLTAQQPAYLVGSVAPDARVDAPDPRAATHFYTYTDPIERPPWQVMLDRHPSLLTPADAAQRAFVAGYVAHLAMDTVWTQQMLAPHFAFADWGDDRDHRFFVLHLLLIYMDERDLAALPPDIAGRLQAAETGDWLPFMPPDILAGWQQLIYEQIAPGGRSRTLDIFGARVERSPAELRQRLDDPAWMQRELWDNVPPSVLADVEQQMRHRARAALVDYLHTHKNGNENHS